MPGIMRERAAVCRKGEEKTWQLNPATASSGYNIHGDAVTVHICVPFSSLPHRLCAVGAVSMK